MLKKSSRSEHTNVFAYVLDDAKKKKNVVEKKNSRKKNVRIFFLCYGGSAALSIQVSSTLRPPHTPPGV